MDKIISLADTFIVVHDPKNRCHFQTEDASRIRKDNTPENLAAIRRIAFSLAKARTPQKMTVKRARFRANLNWNFALEHFFSSN